jgi:subtilisin family serine protease
LRTFASRFGFVFGKESNMITKIINSIVSIGVIMGLVGASGVVHSTASAQERQYLVAGPKNGLPNPAAIAAAGGIWTGQIPSIGVALVRSSNPNFLTLIKKDRSVELAAPDIEIPSLEPEPNSLEAEMAEMAVEGEPSQSEAQSLGPAVLSDDPLSVLEWDNMRLGVPEIHAKGCLGQDVTIAVFDTGIHKDHPDLQGSVIAGISFVDTAPDPFPKTGGPTTVGHGTAVWGIIGAHCNNHIGVCGVAPEAKAISVRISESGDIQMSTILKALDWTSSVGVSQYGVRIINMSHSIKCFDTDPLCRDNLIHLMGMGNRAIAEAYKQGVIFFGSAGNQSVNVSQDDSFKIWPPGHKAETVGATGPCCAACDGNVLNGAEGDYDLLTAYTNYGFLENYFVMPGGQGGGGIGQLQNDCNNYPTPNTCTVAVPSLGNLTLSCPFFDMVWTTRIGTPNYFPFTGTSAATPQASGLAALWLSCHPDLKVGQLVDAIHGSAIDLGDPGYDLLFGFGLGDPAAVL